jgi:hypothetical protein
MTVAAEEALTLQQCLRAGSNGLARRFFRAAAKIVDIPWEIAVGNDLRHPRVKGARPPMLRFSNWYIGKLHVAAARDSTLAAEFLKVVNLIMPPSSLLSPAIVRRVWQGNRKHGLSADSAAVEAAVRKSAAS